VIFTPGNAFPGKMERQIVGAADYRVALREASRSAKRIVGALTRNPDTLETIRLSSIERR
jgi:hypothetical protein